MKILFYPLFRETTKLKLNEIFYLRIANSGVIETKCEFKSSI